MESSLERPLLVFSSSLPSASLPDQAAWSCPGLLRQTFTGSLLPSPQSILDNVPCHSLAPKLSGAPHTYQREPKGLDLVFKALHYLVLTCQQLPIPLQPLLTDPKPNPTQPIEIPSSSFLTLHLVNAVSSSEFAGPTCPLPHLSPPPV